MLAMWYLWDSGFVFCSSLVYAQQSNKICADLLTTDCG